MRGFSKSLKPVTALVPAVRSAAVNGPSVDRIGFDGLSFLFSAGAWVDGTHSIVAEESEDGTTWTAVAASNLSGAFPVISTAAGGGTLALVGYMGDARYVRARLVVVGATTGATIGVAVLLGRARQKPAS